ncbi:MAG: beta-N-acetylglucosaminidase domain-containing protein [Caulobacterales bacterium]
MSVELGVIEGYYGTPWTWAERQDQARFLAAHGYGFFLYAPKADPFLRRRWREDHPADEAVAMKAMAACCREVGMRFGVGLSPYEVYRDFNDEAQAALARKLKFFDAVGVEELAILFDDMAADQPDLAETQIRIIDWTAERTGAAMVTVCPTIYTDDPLLERAFGAAPADYLDKLGAALDPAIRLFWTGEEVCSREYSPGHLTRIAERMRRKPLLWDNYPVNDGPLMSPFLHLRAFTGRPAAIGPHLAGHAINPCLQPTLFRIPALTLAESYALGEAYEYGRAFEHAAALVLGPELAKTVRGHLYSFQNYGLDRLDNGGARLRARYEGVDHPAAREILAWLGGAYRITREMIEAQ